jgi:hypothetical protein
MMTHGNSDSALAVDAALWQRQQALAAVDGSRGGRAAAAGMRVVAVEIFGSTYFEEIP